MLNSYSILNGPDFSGITVTGSGCVRIFDGASINNGQQKITFPLHNLSGHLYVLIVPHNASTPTATNATNAGVEYKSTDKVCELTVDGTVDVYAYIAAGSFVVYATNWMGV